ncbi:MAG TPA: immunoglobulin domain-containing protein [Verrucomicrobiae bacterium]|nr:immunoglobulin domain-containing protein [Verrucomicrobiae bacterium]
MSKLLSACAVLLGASAQTYAGYSPVPLTTSSFTYDIVIESNYPALPSQNAITVTMDAGPAQTGNTFFELGLDLLNATTINPFGLPHPGTLATNRFKADHVYQMPPTYVGNCAVFIGNYTNIPVGFTNNYTTGSFFVPSPAAYSSLSLLLSAGNGPCGMTCVVNHQDGTSETNGIIGPDWFGAFNSTTGAYTGSQDNTTLVPVEAFSALGRATTTAYGNTGNVSQCVLWSLDIPLTDTASPVTSISFTYHDGGRCCIFAMSGSTGGAFSPITVTGYDGDPIIEQTPLPLPYNATMDNGTNISSGGAGANTWFEVGWDTNHPLSGFPAHNSILTSISTGRQYQMAPSYQGPMSTLIDTNHQIANITPITPAAYTAVSLLTAGASIGAANVMTNVIILQHADGVNETNFFFGFDWFNNGTVSAGVPVVVAYGANGRANFNAARSLQNVTNLPFLDPRIFESQFQLLHTTSPITNIVCKYFSAGGANWTTYVLAVSATTDPIAVTLSPLEVPAAQNVYAGQTAQFGVATIFGTAPQFQWQKGPGPNGPFSNLSDGSTGTGSTISGVTTTNLTISDVGASDVAYYTCLVTNSVTTNVQLRTPAPLTLLHSTGTNIARIGDSISDVEVFASPAGETASSLVDGTLAPYLNYGTSGTNIAPFDGPVSFVITPAVGSSIVYALRFYTTANSAASDPADFMLEGSNDSGTNWTEIVPDQALALPDTRNLDTVSAINVTNDVLQEVDFANTSGYTSYRVTFNNTKTNTTAAGLQIGEIQFLGSLTPIAPGITTQPFPASQTLFAGATLSFGVVANGPSPITYQWYQNSTTKITGATNATYSKANITMADEGTYDVVVSNVFGVTTSSIVNLTIIAPVGLYANAIVADHPIAYFRLDETPDDGAGNNGIAAIDYVGSHDGVYSNAVIGVAGYSTNDSDTAAAFGTVNTNFSYVTDVQGINFAKPTNQDGTFSIEAWVNPLQTGNGFAQIAGAGIVCLGYGGGGEQFAIDTGGTSNSFRFYFRDAAGAAHNANANSKNADGNWHHVVAVLDEPNKSQYLWVDGQLAALVPLPTNGMGVLADNAPTNRFTIGWRNGSTTNAFAPSDQLSGSVDEVSLYNYALTSNQVQAHFLAAGIAPRLLISPTNITASEGSTISFVASAYGTAPLSMQWYHSDGANPTTAIAGQTNGTFTLANISQSLNGNYYQFVASNSFGSVATAPVFLTVVSGPPVIQTDLQPQYAVYSGYPLVLSVTAGGSPPLTYQWQDNGTNLSDNARISGSTSNTLTILNTELGDSGNYQVLVNNTNNGGSTAASTTAAVTVLPVLGFNGLGSGWTSQGTSGTSLYVAPNVIQLTSSLGSEANSSFFSFPVYVGGFKASWLYQVTDSGGGNPADGIGFVIQNDPRGASALGAGGGTLALNTIIPSVELEFNIYGGVASGVGIAFDINGAIGPNTFPSPVLISSGDVIATTLTYLNGKASLTLQDTNAGTSYSTSASINVPSTVGANTAYVGFTGADGGSFATQQVSNFQFISLLNLSATASGTNLNLTWPAGVGGYVLQKSASLTSPSWSNVTNAVTTVSGMNQVTVPVTGSQEFYQLVLP